MKAIILFSGGTDSTLVLVKALREGKTCLALTFDYGQRHAVELDAAQALATHYNVPQKVISLPPSTFAKSSLVDGTPLPKDRSPEEIQQEGISTTYVPARNTLFLAYALAQAEIEEADEIHFGANRHDWNGFPDCQPLFIKRFQALIDVATARSLQGHPPRLITPLLEMTKEEIYAAAKHHKIPLEQTWSCYDPTPSRTPCQRCDACRLRNHALEVVYA